MLEAQARVGEGHVVVVVFRAENEPRLDLRLRPGEVATFGAPEEVKLRVHVHFRVEVRAALPIQPLVLAAVWNVFPVEHDRPVIHDVHDPALEQFREL